MFFDRFSIYEGRVEFEDVDFGGVVHHPKYFNFYERARTSACIEAGLSFASFLNRGYTFALSQSDIRYRKPLRYEESFSVLSRSIELRKSSVFVRQFITLDKVDPADLSKNFEELSTIYPIVNEVYSRWVCVQVPELKPVAIPDFWLEAFSTI